jgi:starch phosphorylase
MIGQLKDDQVKLKRIFIESQLPTALMPLKEIANNLWWSWTSDAIELFKTIDPEKWITTYRYNPHCTT